MDKEIMNAYKFGKYVNPAWSRYNNPTNVICNRCKANSLRVCVGYEEIDLCMKCVDIISETVHASPPVKIFMPELTLMEQNMFRNEKSSHVNSTEIKLLK